MIMFIFTLAYRLSSVEGHCGDYNVPFFIWKAGVDISGCVTRAVLNLVTSAFRFQSEPDSDCLLVAFIKVSDA